MDFIEVKELTKQHIKQRIVTRKAEGLYAVNGVSFSIAKNTIFGLVGESGCGKTTLAKAMLFLDPPSSGEVWMDGTRISDLSIKDLRGFRKRMQIIFQDPDSALNPRLRIKTSLEEGLINMRIPRQKRKKRVEELLEMVGIPSSHSSRYPHEFSGGQKQRIVIARALSMMPDFLILDEPVSNLDVSIQAQIINLILDLKQELSLTYLFISHDLNLVAYLSDIIAVMYEGRIVELAETDELMNNPVHPYTLKLFSSVPGIEPEIEGKEIDLEEEIIETKKAVTGMIQKGCPYYDLCVKRKHACVEVVPHLTDTGKGHLAACLERRKT